MSEVTIVYCKPCGYLGRAEETASALRKELDVTASLSPGTGGIFEVRVDGEVVATRTKGRFPDTAEIVAAVSAALAA